MTDVLTPDAGSSRSKQLREASMAWFALAILVIATVFGAIDRQIIVLVVEPMKHDLALDDFHIGAIQGLGPILFAAFMGYPLAWLADRVNRSKLLAACILFWSAATAARGFAASFPQLMLFSTGIAVGEAVLTPVIYSLIPDLFSEARRPFANFVFFGATVIGVGLGLMLGGAALSAVEALRALLPDVLQNMAGWRLACLLVAAPGVPIAMLVLLIPSARRFRAPAKDGVTCATETMAGYIRNHWLPVGTMYLAMGLYAFGFAIIGTWLPAAIIRDLGANANDVGVQFGLTYTVAAAAGIVIATMTVNYWRRLAGRGLAFRALSWTMGLAVLPLFGLLLASTPGWAYFLTGAMVTLAIMGSAYSPTMLQDIAPPLVRARISAIAMIIYAAVGASGPVLAGAFSDWSGPGQGHLMMAIVLLSGPAFLIAAIMYRALEQPMLRVIDASTGHGIDH